MFVLLSMVILQEIILYYYGLSLLCIFIAKRLLLTKKIEMKKVYLSINILRSKTNLTKFAVFNEYNNVNSVECVEDM